MPDSPATIKQLVSIVKEQNKRIDRLEKQIKTLGVDHNSSEQEVQEPKKKEKVKPKSKMNISPTMVITSVGIIGIVIGLISFFMYAISNNWIGPMAQISIGVITGLVLFVVGYLLYDKHQK